MTEAGTFGRVAEELAVVDGDEQVAEERAEQVEERDDAVGILQGHGRTPRDDLQQGYHGPEESEEEREEHGETGNTRYTPSRILSMSTEAAILQLRWFL